jgi:hypothetical protein
LFVAVSALLHARSLSASYLLKFQMVRKYPGRSRPLALAETTWLLAERISIGLRIIKRVVNRHSMRLMKCIYQPVIYV